MVVWSVGGIFYVMWTYLDNVVAEYRREADIAIRDVFEHYIQQHQ